MMLKFLFACFSLALLVPVGVRAQTNENSSACPRISVPPDATIIAMGFSVGQAMADIYIGDPNAPLSVVDVAIEAGASAPDHAANFGDG